MASTPAPSGNTPDRLTNAEWESVFGHCLEQGFVGNFGPAEETEEILEDPVWVELLEEAERDMASGKGVPMLRTAEH